MQDEKQFEQLIMQYTQLKNGSEDISRMIDNEDFDNAITMIKNREHLFLSCKCIRKYLDLTPVQQKELDTLLDEIRDLELKNIKSRDNAIIFFHRLFFMTAPKYIFSAFYSFLSMIILPLTTFPVAILQASFLLPVQPDA